MAAAAAGKREDMVTIAAADLERLVVAGSENVRKFIAKLEKMPRPGELDVAVWPIADERLTIAPLHLFENIIAFGEIDRPAVVGIDHRQIPELRPLIKVRHPGHHRLP